jgi:membrane associated rhomboid family serine protease
MDDTLPPDLDPTGGAPVAGAILALILVAGVIGLSVAPGIVAKGLLRPFDVSRGRRLHTLVTSGFVHATYAHLLFNALTLWSFGFALERRIGSGAFLMLYAIGLLVSDLGTVYRQRNNPDYASLGASGAILAVLFASIVYFPQQSIFIAFVPIPIPAWLFAFGYLAYSLYASRHARDHVNHDAHLGGAAAGLLFVLLTDPAAVRHAMALLL